MTTRLAVFDVDGTLTRTSQVDDACFMEAIRLEWGINGVSMDWGAYEHSTDNAIATEISRVHRGRDATEGELSTLRDRFAGLVREQAATAPALFERVGGVREMLAALPGHGWHRAIATGGWTPSAKLKLAQAAVPFHGIPAAFACDARPREEIIRIATERAERDAAKRFERVVYVGDGVWDARAARRLGIGFVGIAAGERAERLRESGAATVLPDFGDLAAFIAALDGAVIPATLA